MADESQLNHQVSGILQLCAEDLQLSGETFQIVIDDNLLLQDVIIIDPDVPNHIPTQYIAWHQEAVLGEYSEDYAPCVVERSGRENEYHVTYYPKLIPDIFKLSIRELGGYPGWMSTLSNVLIDANTLTSSMTVFDTVNGYVIYGKTPAGTFLSDLRFLNGIPKFSNWAGNIDIRDTLFTDDYSGENIGVRFIGSFTDNKKSHWLQQSCFREVADTVTIQWNNNQKERLTHEQTSILMELIQCEAEGKTANLFENENRFLVEDENELYERKLRSPVENNINTESEKKKKRSPLVAVFFLLVVVIGYTAINNDSFVTFFKQLTGQKSGTVNKPVAPGIQTIAQISAANLEFLNIQLGFDISGLKAMDVEGANVIMDWYDIPDDLHARFNGAVSTCKEEDYYRTTYQLPVTRENLIFAANKPVQTWVQYIHKHFPGNEARIYKSIKFAGEYYYPITIRLTGKDTILKFMEWLINGPSNVLLRKTVITRQPAGQLNAVFYISLFDLK